MRKVLASKKGADGAGKCWDFWRKRLSNSGTPVYLALITLTRTRGRVGGDDYGK